MTHQDSEMIIERQEDVTPAVLKELERAPNARFKEIMGAFVRHMHDFVRESKLTEEEFRTAVNYVVALGKASNETHNEGVLIAGSLGISSLVCLLNNGDNGQTETDASLLGPFWRDAFAGHAERRLDRALADAGAGDVRRMPGSATAHGKPIEGAEVDIWQSSTEGFYENQDPVQADMNLRGKFFTDERRPHRVPQHQAGRLSDPGRRPDRRTAARAGPPQHAARASAFPRSKDGFKTLISQIYVADDKIHRQRRAVRRHAPPDRQLRAARERQGAGRGREGRRGTRSTTTS